MNKKTAEKITKDLMDKYGHDRVFNAGIDAAMENIGNLIKENKYKEAIVMLEKVVKSLKEVA